MTPDVSVDIISNRTHITLRIKRGDLLDAIRASERLREDERKAADVFYAALDDLIHGPSQPLVPVFGDTPQLRIIDRLLRGDEIEDCTGLGVLLSHGIVERSRDGYRLAEHWRSIFEELVR